MNFVQSVLFWVLAGLTLFLGVYFFSAYPPYSAALFAVSGALFSIVANRDFLFSSGLTWPLLKCRIFFPMSRVRVSVAYLVEVNVDDCQLLVRGGRIKTQFQPVGGVYKHHFDAVELKKRFGAEPDIRFDSDPINRSDLRLILRGWRVPGFFSWFRSGTDREFLPNREVYEELISSGVLSGSEFLYFDCAFVKQKTFGLEFDKYSNCRQIIVCDIFRLLPTPGQLFELRNLKAKVEKGSLPDVYFATVQEISYGKRDGAFEISRTAAWLNE